MHIALSFIKTSKTIKLTSKTYPNIEIFVTTSTRQFPNTYNHSFHHFIRFIVLTIQPTIFLVGQQSPKWLILFQSQCIFPNPIHIQKPIFFLTYCKLKHHCFARIIENTTILLPKHTKLGQFPKVDTNESTYKHPKTIGSIRIGLKTFKSPIFRSKKAQ